ncbi:MAG: host attachment protein [Hyphomicrobiales bacterium]
MVRKVVTFVVVADGARARVFRNEGPGKGLVAEPEMSMDGDRRMALEMMSDRPGRSFDSHGVGRHAMEPAVDPRDAVEKEFLEELVMRLDDAAKAGAYDRLVLAAAPRALGELRGMLPATVADRLAGEIAKDLTRLPTAELAGHLGAVMAV